MRLKKGLIYYFQRCKIVRENNSSTVTAILNSRFAKLYPQLIFEQKIYDQKAAYHKLFAVVLTSYINDDDINMVQIDVLAVGFVVVNGLVA